MTTTYIDAKNFTEWFRKAKPGDSVIYYTGKSFVADCEEEFAFDKLRDAIWATAFEKGPDGKFIDRNTLHLVQRRVGPRPEGKAVGKFEYIAVKRGGQS
jgi:hypothetical protein